MSENVFLFVAVLAFLASVRASPNQHRCVSPQKCHILLTADDPATAPGVALLRGTLLSAGFKVTLVAPSRDSSQTSGALSQITPGGILTYSQDEASEMGPIWNVDGTPAEAVTLGLTVIAQDVDLVISGLNIGQNLGKSGVLSSGTVGAALRAANLGYPSVAVSIAVIPQEVPDFPSTAQSLPASGAFMVVLVGKLATASRRLLPPGIVMNVNIPAPFDATNEVVFTRLAEKANFEFVYEPLGTETDNGKLQAVLNVAFPTNPDELQGDTIAVIEGKVSISFLSTDLSRHRRALVERLERYF